MKFEHITLHINHLSQYQKFSGYRFSLLQIRSYYDLRCSLFRSKTCFVLISNLVRDIAVLEQSFELVSDFTVSFFDSDLLVNIVIIYKNTTTRTTVYVCVGIKFLMHFRAFVTLIVHSCSSIR